MVNQVLYGLENFSVTYVDDIAVFSYTWVDHVSHMAQVLHVLQNAGLTIKATKCQISQGTVTYLGHLVGGGPVIGQHGVQHQVQMQRGPLYRTVGSHLALWCNASGDGGSSAQIFEWSVFLPRMSAVKMQIVSTAGPDFSYMVYRDRVLNRREIFIERVRGDSVRMHIIQLQDKDQGVYECCTPNMDSAYYGTYSASLQLIVIPDTLRVLMAPVTLTRDEDDTLQLTCKISTKTHQHTHLSVTWYLQQGAQTHTILSLSRECVVSSGPAYAERHSAGQVSLEKVAETAYRLTLANLRISDRGQFHCEVTEWIQDPDETWYPLTHKQSEKTRVHVVLKDAVRKEGELAQVWIVGHSIVKWAGKEAEKRVLGRQLGCNNKDVVISF
ncbi:immunoglobulin superfamily member 3-like [Ambystoma mexicanum]|uniref:immunoglobulin superfamily member 3-like n=1 Tax=Ambystoma mexicanum TaxID=8296 RepID=UPI0037E82C0F